MVSLWAGCVVTSGGGGDESTFKDEVCNADDGVAVYGMSTALHREPQHVATDIHFIDVNLEGVSEGPWTDPPLFFYTCFGARNPP